MTTTTKPAACACVCGHAAELVQGYNTSVGEPGLCGPCIRLASRDIRGKHGPK